MSTKISNYTDATEYLFGLTSAKTQFSKPGLHLRRISNFLKKVENPQFKYPVIHVGGTAGKGSTTYLIAYLLSELGYRVGIHTSPNLLKINEKFQTKEKGSDLLSCSDKEFVGLVNWFIQNNEKYEQNADKPLTFYEMITAMVFQFFFDKKVDIAVVEVAMGGKLDATNVVNSDVAVVNSVGFDHMEFLGNTLERITLDKMQIMKPEKKFISGLRDKKLNKQIVKHAKQLKSKLDIIGKDFEYNIQKINLSGSEFGIQSSKFKIQNIVLPLVGDYQVHNATLAIQAVGEFVGFEKLNTEIINKAFEKVQIKARFDIISKDPFIILDGAHNELKMRKLTEFIDRSEELKAKPLNLLIGISNGKDAERIFEEIEKLSPQKIVITEFTKQYYKKITSYKAKQLFKLVSQNLHFSKTKIQIERDPHKAFNLLKNQTKNNEYMLVTGSLYLLGKIYEIL